MDFETAKLSRNTLHLQLYKGINKDDLQKAGDECILDIWARSNDTWTDRFLTGINQLFGDRTRTAIEDKYNLYITCKESSVSGEAEFFFELYDHWAIQKEKAKRRDSKDVDKMPDGKVQQGQLIPGYRSTMSFSGFGSRKLSKIK